MPLAPYRPTVPGRYRVFWHVLPLVLATLWLTGCGGLPPSTSRTPSTAIQATPQLPLAQWLEAQRTAAPAPGNGAGTAGRSGFQLLETSEAAYRRRLALIDNARQTLDLQYYTIHYDPSTVLLLDRLRQAARRGVRVRLLLDDFNAVGDNARVLQLDQEPGIEVRMFNPVAGPRGSQAGRVLGSLFDFPRIQQRMHNKILLADSTLAIAGGRNLGDAYFGRSDTSNFLDLDVLAGGPIVAELARSFDHYWNDARAYPVEDLLSPRERAALAAPADSPALVPIDLPARLQYPAPLPAGAVLTWAPAVLLVDKPAKIAPENPQDEADREDNVVEGVLQVLATARQDVLIVSPYFVPGPRMMEVFSTLRRQGVRVRVLTNSLASNDAPLAHVGYARWRKQLLHLGVELFEMPAQGRIQRRLLGSRPDSRASLHVKALVLDQRLLVVGSMNLDPRSALQNTELGIVIRSRSLSRTMTQTLERGLAGSYRVELQQGQLRWLPPPDEGDGMAEAPAPLTSEPDASRTLQLLLLLASPFAPDELL